MINACRQNASYIITILNATEITTPGFYANRSYPEDLSCTWKIKSASNKKIKLIIDDAWDYEIEEK